MCGIECALVARRAILCERGFDDFIEVHEFVSLDVDDVSKDILNSSIFVERGVVIGGLDVKQFAVVEVLNGLRSVLHSREVLRDLGTSVLIVGFRVFETDVFEKFVQGEFHLREVFIGQR